MRAFFQSLVATLIIALPAHGTGNQPVPAEAVGSITAATVPPVTTDACSVAVAQVGAVYAWHISNFLLCPVGLCIPLIEASGYALLLAAAYAVTVCAI
jgi:hypothetical protein